MPIHTHAPARTAVIGAVTKNRVLYRLVGASSAFFCEAVVSLLVMRAPGENGCRGGQ